ncbi:MAG: Hsp70 family protein [Myxococcales bacterium]|nr:Hsp70 family protein [Myxococcales bacterium]
MIDAVVAPALGKGTKYQVEFGHEAPVPSWIYNRLRRWHHLSMLKSADTVTLLERIADGARDQDGIARLVRVVDEDLGLPLHGSIEAAKLALTAAPATAFDFGRPGIAIRAPVERAAFDAWIAPELAAIDLAIDEALAAAGVAATSIDRVFATGGSSLVPAVRGALIARFGADRLVGGDELTSVAAGLAAMAARA